MAGWSWTSAWGPAHRPTPVSKGNGAIKGRRGKDTGQGDGRKQRGWDTVSRGEARYRERGCGKEGKGRSAGRGHVTGKKEKRGRNVVLKGGDGRRRASEGQKRNRLRRKGEMCWKGRRGHVTGKKEERKGRGARKGGWKESKKRKGTH